MDLRRKDNLHAALYQLSLIITMKQDGNDVGRRKSGGIYSSVQLSRFIIKPDTGSLCIHNCSYLTLWKHCAMKGARSDV